MIEPNIWIIQNDIEKFKRAILSIDKTSTDNYLYTNCVSNFTFDEKSMLSKNFNTIFYSEKTNTYIIFMKVRKISDEYIKNYLDANQIKYHEISLKHEKEDIVNKYPYTLENHERKSKEIYIVKNYNELNEILLDTSIKTDNKNCSFYPLVNSTLMFGYSNNSDEIIEIDKINFSGIITTYDKIILFLKLNLKEDIDYTSIKQLVKNLNLSIKKYCLNKPGFIGNELKYDKKLEYKYLKKKKLLK